MSLSRRSLSMPPAIQRARTAPRKLTSTIRALEPWKYRKLLHQGKNEKNGIAEAIPFLSCPTMFSYREAPLRTSFIVLLLPTGCWGIVRRQWRAIGWCRAMNTSLPWPMRSFRSCWRKWAARSVRRCARQQLGPSRWVFPCLRAPRRQARLPMRRCFLQITVFTILLVAASTICGASRRATSSVLCIGRYCRSEFSHIPARSIARSPAPKGNRACLVWLAESWGFEPLAYDLNLRKRCRRLHFPHSPPYRGSRWLGAGPQTSDAHNSASWS